MQGVPIPDNLEVNLRVPTSSFSGILKDREGMAPSIQKNIPALSPIFLL